MNHLPLRDRIQAAADTIGEARRAGTAPAAIIDTLRRNHAAAYRVGASTNTLRVAGITASCTWSKDTGLLDAWSRLATVRLMQMNAGDAA